MDMTLLPQQVRMLRILRWKVVRNDKDLSKELIMRDINHRHDITTTSKLCYEFTMEGGSKWQDLYQEADFQIL